MGVPPCGVRSLARMLKPFSLTFFEYEDGDAFGKLCALLSCAPIFVIVAFVALAASRRDLATLAFLLGQLLNELVNAALKRAIREPRPPSQLRHSGPTDYGMPSAHAQFGFFFLTYFAAWALRHWRVSAFWRTASIGCVACGAGAVSYSRVYLRYHSINQVLAGAGVGVGAGLLYFAWVEAALRPRFAALAGSALGCALWLRDCTHVNNVLLEEYKAVAGKGHKR